MQHWDLQCSPKLAFSWSNVYSPDTWLNTWWYEYMETPCDGLEYELDRSDDAIV